jgi:hypothetical protein
VHITWLSGALFVGWPHSEQKFLAEDNPSPQLLQYLSGSLLELEELSWSFTASINKNSIAKITNVINVGSGEPACNIILVRIILILYHFYFN